MGTTSPDKSSVVHIDSDTKGFILPRMTKVKRDLISNPANGLVVYVTDAIHVSHGYWSNGIYTAKGYHGRFSFYDGHHWLYLSINF